MEAIGCLVPELQSEMRSGCGRQLFEKMHCFYIAMVNFNVSVYTCSCKKAAWKSAKTVRKDSGYKSAWAYIVVNGQKDNRIASW